MTDTFTKSIIIDGKTMIFFFKKIFTATGPACHISVRLGLLTHYFMMKKQTTGWFFIDIRPLPQWIIEMERKLELIITENSKL